MSLIDNDMLYLYSKIVKMGTANVSERLMDKDSYYINCEEENGDYINEYGFENANEFKAVLEHMWEQQGKPEMKAMISCCAAAVYKYDSVKSELKKSGEISPFIYEF